MRTWIRPAAAAENYLVNQSVSNGPCVAIACNVNDANRYEETLGYMVQVVGTMTSKDTLITL